MGNLEYVRLPAIHIHEDKRKLIGCPTNADNHTYLTMLADKKFEEIKSEFGEKVHDYALRYKNELATFQKHGLTDYVLLVNDILSNVDEQEIARGIARGSAAGVLVFYLLGCTQIDPIRHGLYFTRFLNEARVQTKVINGVSLVKGKSMPDVDSDISFRDRQKVIDYIEKEYAGKTAKIVTISRLSGKILIKEVTKIVLDYTETQAKELSDHVERHFGTVEKLTQTYENSPDFKKWADANPKTYQIAQKLELLNKNKSRHPSGIVVSYYPVNDIIPLELSSDKSIVTSYDMYEIANLLVKIDILGLKNADINHDVGKMTGVKTSKIDVNHPSIYEFLQQSENYYGLFQIESGLTKKVVLQVKPKNIDQLSACVAISRPGAYQYIDKYVKYLHGGELESIYPAIDNILRETGNVILYQEQINAICQEVYKMSAIDADQIRYCIGKKDKEGMKKWEPVLYAAGKEQKIPEEVTQYFWDTCNKSADYLFVRGHAFSYAYMTAINTYLKTNHPAEFYLALLQMAKFEPDTTTVIAAIYAELQQTPIRLLPPDLLKSDLEFRLENGNIRYSLGAIKGVAEKSFEKLIQFRKPYSNKFEMFMAAQQAGLSIGILASLLQAGCLEPMFKESRSKLVLEAQLFNLLTPREIPLVLQLAEQFKFDLIAILQHLNKTNNEKGKPIIKSSRMETLRRDFKGYHRIYQQNTKEPAFCNWYFEQQALGFSYSNTLKKIFLEESPHLLDSLEIRSLENDENCQFVGVVTKAYQSKSKAGNKYLKCEVNDEVGNLPVFVFSNKMEKCLEDNGRYPIETDVIHVIGTKKDNAIFANYVKIQTKKIITKLSEVKDLA